MSLTPQGKVPADFPRRFIIDRWVLEPNSLKCFPSCHRVEELRQVIAQTEKEEKHQSEKYVRVLKEGEKALEEKTLQLARTRTLVVVYYGSRIPVSRQLSKCSLHDLVVRRRRLSLTVVEVKFLSVFVF